MENGKWEIPFCCPEGATRSGRRPRTSLARYAQRNENIVLVRSQEPEARSQIADLVTELTEEQCDQNGAQLGVTTIAS